MSWLFWLMLAVIISAFAALTGIKPSNTRPVARTQLMGVARAVLILMAIVVLIVSYRAYRQGLG